MMNDICDINKCSGCGACESTCPKDCISLKENKLGVLIPVIDTINCIECGKCKKVCPQLSDNIFYTPQKCYAAYLANKKNRLDSSSGGIAWLLYYTFLKINENSIVFGVEMDENGYAFFSESVDINDIKKFQGSKYVQASNHKIFLNIETYLSNNKYVLFIGTPCQVAACYSFLRNKRINIAKLYTVDLLCHGVSPQYYLKEELRYLKKKYGLSTIKNISFRSNRKFRNFHLFIAAEKKSKKYFEYNRYSQEDPYFYGFLEGITLRESCFHCIFSKKDRVSDITIGDFIGLAEQPSSTIFEGEKENCSLVLCNTRKGISFFDGITEGLEKFERPIREAYESAASLQEPFRKSEVRDRFLKEYEKGNFVQTIESVSKSTLRKNKIHYAPIRVLKQMVIKIKGGILCKGLEK